MPGREILLVEDNASAADRPTPKKPGRHSDAEITVRVHRVNGRGPVVAATGTYAPNTLPPRNGRVAFVRRLLKRSLQKRHDPVVVAAASFGAQGNFLEMLCSEELPFVVEVRPSTTLEFTRPQHRQPVRAALEHATAKWRALKITLPDKVVISCSAANLGSVRLPVGTGRLFAVQIGGLPGVHRGTIIGVSSFSAPLRELAHLVAHTKWIRRAQRTARRAKSMVDSSTPMGSAATLRARSNITLARQQDSEVTDLPRKPNLKGKLGKAARTLNVVDLFSGAGGLGLGFLMGGGPRSRYRIVYSAESNPIYVETLRHNHRAFERAAGRRAGSRTPSQLDVVDLRTRRALEEARNAVASAGNAHILIGGPPCQGFSMANRNSWSDRNPNNDLVDVFIRYVRALRPLAFLMENVQGILWTPSAGSDASVVDTVERRLSSAGYVLFPKLLDAVWYGVPQHRTRFFLIGLHRDLGYRRDDFGDWGPFPVPTHGPRLTPYVTVHDAIRDLPAISNGHASTEDTYHPPPQRELERNSFLSYVRSEAPRSVIRDHTTSKHADYVIDRYRRIPQGGNWESIKDQLSNYSDVSRTHSNIYRRLRWEEPAVTIGHYRKSMLVHPDQHRGLSLREAARLQSFPDWSRFAGSPTGCDVGLVHKQQQLANAVCPLVAKALAEHILRL